jgi:hypothetical protein
LETANRDSTHADGEITRLQQVIFNQEQHQMELEHFAQGQAQQIGSLTTNVNHIEMHSLHLVENHEKSIQEHAEQVQNMTSHYCHLEESAKASKENLAQIHGATERITQERDDAKSFVQQLLQERSIFEAKILELQSVQAPHKPQNTQDLPIQHGSVQTPCQQGGATSSYQPAASGVQCFDLSPRQAISTVEPPPKAWEPTLPPKSALKQVTWSPHTVTAPQCRTGYMVSNSW